MITFQQEIKRKEIKLTTNIKVGEKEDWGDSVRRKTFKDNESYFEFYNEMKDKIIILEFKITDKIKIGYELKEE